MYRSLSRIGRKITKTTRAALAVLEALESRSLLSGSIDGSFGAAGLAVADGGVIDADFGYDVAVLSSGKILVAGRSAGDFALARFNANGTLDATFGAGGVVTTDLGSYGDTAFAMAVQADGRIVLAGQVNSGGARSFDFALVRYNADGSLDNSFGDGGVVTTDFANDLDVARAVLVDSQGRIVVAGSATVGGASTMAVARYDSVGLLDPSFGAGGRVTIFGPAGDAGAFALAVTAGDAPVLAGYAFSNVSSTSNLAVARLLPTGVGDATFGAGGLAVIDLGQVDDSARALSLMGDGRLVVAGVSGRDFMLARLTGTGTLDNTFGSGGLTTTDFSGGTDTANDVVMQADGSLMLVGTTDNGNDANFAVARYLPGGQADQAFGSGGILVTDAGSVDDSANAAALQPDGKLVAAGFSFRDDTDYDFALARYTVAMPNRAPLADGGGPYEVNEGGLVQLSATASLDPDGSIVSWEWDLNYDGANFDTDSTSPSPMFSAAGLDGPTVRTIAVRVTDDRGASAVASGTVTVRNVAPSASLGGPGTGVRAQLLGFNAAVADVGADAIEVAWDFGDGTASAWQPATAAALSPSHIFKSAGSFSVKLNVRDDDGGMAAAVSQVVVKPWELQADAANPGKKVLVIGGTPGNDLIMFASIVRGMFVPVVNFVPLGVFNSDVSRIVVFAGDGNDAILMSGSVTTPAELYGEGGNDILLGGRGDDTLVGGAGSDLIQGGGGRDTVFADSSDRVRCRRNDIFG